MKLIQIIPVICVFLFHESNSVRLDKLFQFIDGYQSEHNLRGFLHVGNDYAIFLRTPNPHDKYLVYELYEVKNVPDAENYKPRMLAITKVPTEYVKEQLTTFRNELYKANRRRLADGEHWMARRLSVPFRARKDICIQNYEMRED
ncbi:hypothetical protein PYW07_017273 [Mythimna separata]|uniref:Uncharacterized protein n=1 Tax=Mythimna separata TaxID=271217 RepID=A0AAD8DXC7_MYTSE|nr:hypothetical protein PYW07_017273 [Mythimna separata]